MIAKKEAFEAAGGFPVDRNSRRYGVSRPGTSLRKELLPGSCSV